MDDSPVVWDDANTRHLVHDHPERRITHDQVNQVLTDPNRREQYDRKHRSTVVIGVTARGRKLVVAWIDHPEGRYPIHARPAGKRARKVT
jgi:hypothetical protein